MRRRATTTRRVALLVAVLVLLAVGAVVGTRLPWGAKTARSVQGVAYLHDATTGFASFESDDGQTATFGAADVWWGSDSRSGTGRPPCLREAQEVDVEAGLMWVRHPEGGEHLQVVWLHCP